MRAIQLLHKQLQFFCPFIHQKRLTALIEITQVLVETQRLSVTGLGRGFRNHTTAKHNIKRVDRLVGNSRLQFERISIYKVLTKWLIGNQHCPVILVDWSDLTADREQQLLRAAIPIGGRSLTIYEEIHPLRNYANRRVHRQFLTRLSKILPSQVVPILVTDAGFRGTWFELVNQLNWHWIGRIRNRDFVSLSETADNWQPCKQLYQKATRVPKALGAAWLTRSRVVATLLHIVKKSKKNRVAKSKFGRPAHNSRSHKIARREREPWLLATSPSLAKLTAKEIVAIYQKRMQIEEGFRDIKSNRLGLGLSDSLTKHPKRLEILLLIGALAIMVLWMTGIAAIKQKRHYQLQSNTTRNRNVLSCIFIGIQIMRYDPGGFSKMELLYAFDQLKSEVIYAF